MGRSVGASYPHPPPPLPSPNLRQVAFTDAVFTQVWPQLDALIAGKCVVAADLDIAPL